jgi:hypothetical protein
MSAAFEVNFDGLIGPSHNYGGLSDGNLASSKKRKDDKAAAREIEDGEALTKLERNLPAPAQIRMSCLRVRTAKDEAEADHHTARFDRSSFGVQRNVRD